jgi:hypothetical protein
MTGRPVDVEIIPKAHALLSASSAERWLTCTPSARLEEALADEESSYATDGTAAHAFAEVRLRWLLGQTSIAEYVATYEATKKLYGSVSETWEPADWEAINSYVDYVMGEANRLEASVVLVEHRVDYSRFAEGGFGTSDVIIVSEKHNTIKSIDLKFGKGVAVSAANNSQAKLYALGAVLEFDPELIGNYKNIEWTIHQPRINNVNSDSTSFDELLDWATRVVAPAAKLAWEGKGRKVPSEKACRFCKAKATCRERVAENVNIARRDFMGDPDLRFDPAKLDEHLMGMDEVAKILPLLDDWMNWARALQQYALTSVRDRGEEIEGYKLVRGRSVRKWSTDSETLILKLQELGIETSAILEDPAPPAPRSVAQLEKKLGAKRFAAVVKESGLVEQPPGVPALVPDTDPRPAIDAAAEARAEFGEEEK